MADASDQNFFQEKDLLSLYEKSKGDPDRQNKYALKLTLFYYQSSRFDDMSTWANKLVEHASLKEILNNENMYISIVDRLFATRRTANAGKLAADIFNRLCLSESKSIPKFFHNAVLLNLIQRDGKEALTIFHRAKSCNLSKENISKALNVLSKYAYFVKNKEDFLKITKIVTKENNYVPCFFKNIILSNQIIQQNVNNYTKLFISSKQIDQKFKKWKELKIPMELDDLEIYSDWKFYTLQNEQLVSHNKSLNNKDPKLFSSEIRVKLKKLEYLTLKVKEIMNIGSDQTSLKSYSFLIKNYQGLSVELKDLLNTSEASSNGWTDNQKQQVLQLSQSLLQQSELLENNIKNFKLQQRVNNSTSLNYKLIDSLELTNKDFI